MSPPRPCIEPNCPNLTTSTRCPTHERQRQRQRNARRTHYHGDWPKTRAAILTAWRAQHGDVCPGDEHHAAHPCHDLTVDHVVARSTAGGLTVVCRSANSSKGARTR